MSQGAHPPPGQGPWNRRAVHHGGLSCSGLCPAASGRLCHPGIQHCITHAWKMHKGCRGGTAVHHDRETRGVFTPWKQPFLTPLILWAERNVLCFIKIISAFYDSCHSLDPELAVSPSGSNLHPLQNNIISLYILEHTKDATQQKGAVPSRRRWPSLSKRLGASATPPCSFNQAPPRPRPRLPAPLLVKTAVGTDNTCISFH